MAGRRRLHYGRRTPVIPPEWAAAHQPVADGTRTDSTVSLRKPGGTQEWSDPLERNVTVPHPPYADGVPARVLTLTGEAQTVRTADDTEVTADVLVTVPIGTQAPARGDLVHVTTCPHPSMQDRTLQVVHTGGRSHPWELDVWCRNTD